MFARKCGRCANDKALHLPYARGQIIAAVPSFLAARGVKPPCHRYTRKEDVT